MGDSKDAAELRKTAKNFLHGALWPRRASVDDIAEEVISLVLGDEPNPLTDLIKEKYAASREETPPLPALQSLRPSTSKLSLKFPRMRNRAVSTRDGPKGPGDKRPSDAGRPMFKVDVGSPSADAKPHQDLGIDPKRPNTATSGACSDKATAPGQINYNCVFCGNDYSVKGTCKRHIEDLHVAKRYYECMKCQHVSRSVPEAKKHMAQCSVGIIDWNTVKPPHRKVYGSEFVAGAIFKTQQSYIEHLLELSALPKNERPKLSWHLKLRNLLDQPEFRPTLQALSKRLFESTEGWKDVRWEHERARRAVHRLEYGTLRRENEAQPKEPSEVIRTFIDDLFADRLLAWNSKSSGVHRPSGGSGSASAGSSNAPNNSNAATPRRLPELHCQPAGMEMQQNVPSAASSVQQRYYSSAPNPGPPQDAEQSGKRPLSYETATQIPHRRPPGPPTTTSAYCMPGQPAPNPVPNTVNGQSPWVMQPYQAPTPISISPEMPPPYEINTSAAGGFSAPVAPPLPPPPPSIQPPTAVSAPYTPHPPMEATSTNQFGHYFLDDTILDDAAFLNIVSPSTQMNGGYPAAGQPQHNTAQWTLPTQHQLVPQHSHGQMHTWFDTSDTGG